MDATNGVSLEDAIAEGASELITFIVDANNGGAPTVVLDMVATNASADNDVTDLGTSGYYGLELTAANVNYVGRAVLSITNAAVHCPVFHEFTILAANVFDSLVLGAATDLLDVNQAQVLGTAVHASSEAGTQCVEVVRWGGNDIAATGINGTPKVDVAGYNGTAAHAAVTAGIMPVDVHQWLGTDAHAASTAGVPEVTVHGVAADAITAAAIANGAIDAATFAADVDAEVQAYVNLALLANNLDHLALTPTVAADMTAEVADNTILSRILGNGDTSTFVPSTDGLRANAVDVAATHAHASAADTQTVAATVAAAVWGCDATTQQTAGTFGQAIGDPAADANTIYKAVVTDAAGATVGVDVVALKAETVEILTDTAVIGALGAGLTALATAAELAKVPKSDAAVTWNATALASIQTEANDALVANNLDHLMFAPLHVDAADMTTEVVDKTVLSRILGAGDTSTFVATDGLHAAGVDLDAILADTNELQVDDYPTSIAAVKGDTAAILVDTGTDGVLVAVGGIGATAFAAGAVNAAAIAAAAIGDSELGGKLAAHLLGVLTVVVGVGSDTTHVVLNATTGINGGVPSATNDFYNGRVIVFTSGALAGQATAITDYVGATVTLEVVALTDAPAAAVTAVMV